MSDSPIDFPVQSRTCSFDVLTPIQGSNDPRHWLNFYMLNDPSASPHYRLPMTEDDLRGLYALVGEALRDVDMMRDPTQPWNDPNHPLNEVAQREASVS